MFKDLLKNLTDQATKLVGQYKNKTFLQATMTAAVIVAQADGVIQPSEKQKIFGYAKASEFLNVFDFEDVQKEFEHCAGKYEFDFDLGKQECLIRLGKLAKDMDLQQKKCIMMVSCAIGKADGNFDPAEQEVVREIRTAMGLADTDFPI